MTYTILWLVAFLMNGDPLPYTIVVNVPCDDTMALNVARVAFKSTGEIQDTVLWRCEEATSPGPAPKKGV